MSETIPATEIPLSPAQRQAAGFLARSQTETVACTVFGEIDVTALVNFRRKTAMHVGFTHFILRALAEALLEHPQMNAHFDGTIIQPLATTDIAIAVSMPNGDLVTPVLRELDLLNACEIKQVTTALVERVRAGGMNLKDIKGAGFTLSNIGAPANGSTPAARWTSPIIPVPQTAILALTTAREQAVVHNGDIIIASILPVSLSFDHRAINGIKATQFIESLGRALAKPEILMTTPARSTTTGHLS